MNEPANKPIMPPEPHYWITEALAKELEKLGINGIAPKIAPCPNVDDKGNKCKGMLQIGSVDEAIVFDADKGFTRSKTYHLKAKCVIDGKQGTGGPGCGYEASTGRGYAVPIR